jgi:hypothetical protein
MKFTSILIGVLATATAVAATKPKSSAAPSSKYEEDCDEYEYPASSKVYPSSSKKAPVHISSTPCSEEPEPKSTYYPSSKAVPVKHSSSYKPHHPYPVKTKTVIVVVPTFTKKCHGPTIIVEFEQTIHVTIEGDTYVTFSKGPYTRTKTELECATTTTEYFEIDECPTDWPYAIGQGYVPIPCSYTPYTPCSECTAAPVPVYSAPAVAGPVVIAGPAASGAVSAPGAKVSSPVAIFTSGASHAQAGVVALIAGVVAALMVL